jgi:hypothetical protein
VVSEDETPEVLDEPTADDGETPTDDGTADDDDSDSDGENEPAAPATPADSGDTADDPKAPASDGDNTNAPATEGDSAGKVTEVAEDKPENNSTNEDLVSEGPAAKTPLAPATGSDSSNESKVGSSSVALFGHAGGAMAGLGLAIVALIRRRKDADVR